MTGQPWRAGFRKMPAAGSVARMKQTVIAKALIEHYSVHVFDEPDIMAYGDDGSPDEDGPEIHLQIQRAGGKYVRLLLGRMTVQELNALKETFDFAFEQALPVAEHRDQVAKEAADNGDYSYTRRLRSHPTVHVLKRPGEQFASELQRRREADVPGDGTVGAGHVEAGADGGPVAITEQANEVTGDSPS